MTKYLNGASGASGDTTYTAAEATVSTTSTNPAPVRSSLCYYSSAAAGATATARWAIDGTGNWRFRRYIQIGAVTSVNGGSDLDMVRLTYGASGSETTGLIVRGNGSGFLRVVASGGGFPYTSTTAIPAGAWYRMEGYGSGVNNTARIALYPLETSLGGPGGAAIIDTGDGTANNVGGPVLSGMSVAQGSTAPTFWREGKISGATNYGTNLVAWDESELHTGADAPQSFIGPYATTFSVTGVLTPANPQLYSVQRTLTLTASGSNGNALTYSVDDWGDGTGGSAGQSSNVFTHTFPTMAAGAAQANYSIVARAAQAG